MVLPIVLRRARKVIQEKSIAIALLNKLCKFFCLLFGVLVLTEDYAAVMPISVSFFVDFVGNPIDKGHVIGR